jgi:hypothetical protein
LVAEKQPELITPYYVEQNTELHKLRPDYGANGHRHAPQIRELAEAMAAESILDYGCGKATLSDALTGFNVRNYDPALPEYAGIPEPADLVVCGDVLEHIEPECLFAVLDDLARVTKKVLFANIATRAASKSLPDGRNAHLIQQGLQFWLPALWDRFTLGSIHNLGGELLVVCGAKQ